MYLSADPVPYINLGSHSYLIPFLPLQKVFGTVNAFPAYTVSSVSLDFHALLVNLHYKRIQGTVYVLKCSYSPLC